MYVRIKAHQTLCNSPQNKYYITRSLATATDLSILGNMEGLGCPIKQSYLDGHLSKY